MTAKKPEDIQENGTVWWFGPSWSAPICNEAYHVETPVGKKCIFSNAEIKDGDHGVVMMHMGEKAERRPALLDPFIESLGILGA